MKNFALSLALALSFSGSAQAALVEVPAAAGLTAGVAIVHAAAGPRAADLTVAQAVQVVAPPANMSELPEPEVFAMMLLGLCLIGYRASRHSDEKFE